MRLRSLLPALLLPLALAASAQASWVTDPSVNTLVGSPSTGGRASPAAVSDGSGGTFVAWREVFTGTAIIRVQHLDPNGNPLWTASGVPVSFGNLLNRDSVVVARDGAGGMVIAWRDLGSNNPDVYANRVDASGNVLWGANGVVVCNDPNAQGDIAIASDDSMGAIVAWRDQRNNATNGSDVFAQRILANGQPNWTANGVLLGQGAATQRHPVVQNTGLANPIWVMWEDSRNGLGFDLYAIRLSHQGQQTGGAGLPIATVSGDQVNMASASDGSGGVFLAWEDDRNLGTSGRDIEAQHLNATGGLWNAGGSVAVCAATGTQVAASILPDGVGGLFVAWQDARGGAGTDDVYAQRLSASGVAQWTANGVVVSAAAGMQTEPHVVTDGAGGIVVEFLDTRFASNLHDVYAQRMNGSGVAQWTADGVALMDDPADAIRPAFGVDDGRGGIVVGCTENRSVSDVYLQRIDRYGFLGVTEPVITAVGDIPNDQGGRVKLTFQASYLEFDPLAVVTTYDLFRSVPATLALSGARHVTREPEAARLDPAGTVLITGASDYAWEFLATISALDVSSYSYVASTTGDSVGGSNPPTIFMVQGRAANGRYWTSQPDSGYSVDNLSPPTPAPFTGNYAAGATHLHWDPDTAPDLANYRLYRGSTSSFVPGPGSLIASPPDTGFADAGPAGSYYKLSAVDVHGNESGFALLQPDATSGVPDGAPPALALSAPRPTPATGDAEIRFALPRAGRVTLAIYDVSGRRVRTLLAGAQTAGAHAMRIGGAPAAPGLYAIRLDTPWGSRARSFVWLK